MPLLDQAGHSSAAIKKGSHRYASAKSMQTDRKSTPNLGRKAGKFRRESLENRRNSFKPLRRLRDPRRGPSPRTRASVHLSKVHACISGAPRAASRFLGPRIAPICSPMRSRDAAGRDALLPCPPPEVICDGLSRRWRGGQRARRIGKSRPVGTDPTFEPSSVCNCHCLPDDTLMDAVDIVDRLWK
jgi:hypothetical protein